MSDAPLRDPLWRIERNARSSRGDELAEMFRRSEHPQRVSGRRRIHNHHRVRILLGDLTDAHPGHQLIDAGQRELEKTAQLFFVEIGSAIAELEETCEILV